MQHKQQPNLWRRYFGLLASVGAFLLIAGGLIAVNIYESGRLAQGTLARDLSGPVRTSVEIIMRAMLEIEKDVGQGLPVNEDLRKTIASRTKQTTDSLRVFRDGGRVEEDQEVSFKAASGEMLKHTNELAAVWQPYSELLQPLVAKGQTPGTIDMERLRAAIRYGRANRDLLFAATTRLVDDSLAFSATANNALRRAQAIGAGLILLNFVFAVLFALRRLLKSDRAVVQLSKQTDDILATVKEGLFLVTNDFQIGGQMSTSLPQIMQRNVKPGMSLLEVLGTMVQPQTLDAARDYLGLLFGKRVKENLVASLNPLSEVPVSGGADGRGQPQTRYLNFQFNRVHEDGEVVYLLVTVSDATERVRLAAEVAAAKSRTREEMEALLRVLSRDSSDVRFFLHRIGVILERVNDSLRQAAARRSGTDYAELVNAVFRDIHSIKSEAAALNLDMIEGMAHAFELDLIDLRDRGEVEGNDMVKLTVHLDDMFDCAATIKDFLERISGGKEMSAPIDVTPSARILEGWRSLAQRIAQDQGKQIRVESNLEVFDRLPTEMVNTLRTIGLQLLRNSVSHGIESPEERLSHGKPAIGTVMFSSHDAGSRQIEFVVRDDGRGIEPFRIREALARSGRYTEEQLAALSDRELIPKIFEPGVSTSERSDRDAGHGVGMDLVMKQVRAMSGTISLSSKPGSHTEFRLRLPITAPRSTAADSAELQYTF